MSGIIIFGAAGAGKTTLGGELARLLHFRHLDLDDYIWRWDTELPFSIFRPNEEIIADLTREITAHPRFVMSGGIGRGFRNTYHCNAWFGLAVFMTVPHDLRMERLRAREFANYGERTLEGGDMYEHTQNFLDEASRYDTNDAKHFGALEQHEKWITELACPVLRVDGAKPIIENAKLIAEQYLKII